jgi:hypothetical protein
MVFEKNPRAGPADVLAPELVSFEGGQVSLAPILWPAFVSHSALVAFLGALQACAAVIQTVRPVAVSWLVSQTAAAGRLHHRDFWQVTPAGSAAGL